MLLLRLASDMHNFVVCTAFCCCVLHLMRATSCGCQLLSAAPCDCLLLPLVAACCMLSPAAACGCRELRAACCCSLPRLATSVSNFLLLHVLQHGMILRCPQLRTTPCLVADGAFTSCCRCLLSRTACCLRAHCANSKINDTHQNVEPSSDKSLFLMSGDQQGKYGSSHHCSIARIRPSAPMESTLVFCPRETSVDALDRLLRAWSALRFPMRQGPEA